MLLGDYDEKQVLEEINVNLEEEYDKSDVYCPWVQKMVIKQLHDLIETIPTKSLQKTVNDFLEENPGLSIGEYIKKFTGKPTTQT